jgi:hypothetical protein
LATIELTKVEEHPNSKILFRVRVNVGAGQMEFPIGVEDKGSPMLNEMAVLRSTLGFAEELASSVRLRLGLQP